MLAIYGVHRSRASRNIWLAHETGLPFRHAPVIQPLPRCQSKWPRPIARRQRTRASRVAGDHRVSDPPAERDSVQAQAAIDALWAPFAALAESGFLVGGRFTVVAVNVAEVVRYALPAPELFEATPALQSWIEACHARPAYRRMMVDRELEPA